MRGLFQPRTLQDAPCSIFIDFTVAGNRNLDSGFFRVRRQLVISALRNVPSGFFQLADEFLFFRLPHLMFLL